jgi:hypothetical protein
VIQAAHLSEIITRSPWIQPLWYSPVILVVAGLTAFGYGVSFRDNSGGIVEWYFAVYVLIYLFWPFDVGARFVFPVFPLALLYFWRGAKELKSFAARRTMLFMGCGFLVSVVLAVYTALEVLLWRDQTGLQAKMCVIFWILSSIAMAASMASMGRKRSQSLIHYFGGFFNGKKQRLASALAVTVLVVVGFTIQVRAAIYNLRPDPKKYVHQGSKEAADWIAGHTRRDDAVMAQQISIVHRISGRKVVHFPVRSDANIIMDTIRRHDVKFIVVITSSRGSNLQPTESTRVRLLAERIPQSVVLVQWGDSYEIYRVLS